MTIADESQNVPKCTKRAAGRKPAHESRAQEIRARLLVWKQAPESMRPSLRELEAETGVSHQLFSFYLKGLDRSLAYERAKRLRAEGRPFAAGLIEAMADNIEELRQAAKRGPLNHWQIKMLKLHARHFSEAQANTAKSCNWTAVMV